MEIGLFVITMLYLIILKRFSQLNVRLIGLFIFPILSAIYPTYLLQAEVLPQLNYGHAIFAIVSLTGWAYVLMMAIVFYTVSFLTLLSVFILWRWGEKKKEK